MDRQPRSKEEHARTLQIIVFAIAMGLAMFIAIAFFIGQQREVAEPMISYVAAALATGTTVVRFAIGPIIVGAMRRQISGNQWRELDEHGRVLRLCGILQTKTIVEVALLEGAGLVATVAYIVEGQLWTLAVAGGLLAMIVMSFPNTSRIEDWIRDQQQIVESELT